MYCVIKFLTSDKFWFLLLQGGLILLYVYSFYKYLNKTDLIVIKRGEKSRGILMASAGAIITILISIVFQISTYPIDGKVLFYLMDLGIVLQLCFYSPWFTNKLISFKVSFEKREY